MMINTLSAFVNPEKNTAEIIVNVQDKNDNAPVFDQTIFTASLREDTPIGAIATKIHATDNDGLPINKKLNYAISTYRYQEILSPINSLFMTRYFLIL